MKRLFLLTVVSLIVSLGFPLISLSAIPTNCDEQEEVFGFHIPTYTTQHEGAPIINLKVTYRYMPNAITKDDYPDFVPIRKDVETFIANYPNHTDFWEIVNKKLVRFILDKYPQLSSLMVKIDVPNPTFSRFSVVRSTRPQACPVTIP